MNEEKKVLVFGGSVYIGKELCKYFSEKNKLVAGTYCHSPSEKLIYFDLENPNLARLEIDLKNVRYGIICSAITKIDECKRDKEKSYKINVKGVKSLIEQLFQSGIIPVFLSSDCVFNGKEGHYSESARTNPCNVYGNQKKLIEDFLLESNETFLITRLSKIFGLRRGDETLLTSMAEQLQNNEDIRCAEDQIFSATYVEDLAQVLDLALEKNLSGLYNVASPEPFSRAEIARMIKSQLKIKSGRIIPCSIRDFDFLDLRPLDTSLNVEKIHKATNFKFTEMRTCIGRLEKLYNLEFTGG